MAARFFVDENDLALGKALVQLHVGIVFPGHVELRILDGQSVEVQYVDVVIPGRSNVRRAKARDDSGPVPIAGANHH